MKKILSILLIIVMVFSLAACGKSATVSKPENETQNEKNEEESMTTSSPTDSESENPDKDDEDDEDDKNDYDDNEIKYILPEGESVLFSLYEKYVKDYKTLSFEKAKNEAPEGLEIEAYEVSQNMFLRDEKYKQFIELGFVNNKLAVAIVGDNKFNLITTIGTDEIPRFRTTAVNREEIEEGASSLDELLRVYREDFPKLRAEYKAYVENSKPFNLEFDTYIKDNKVYVNTNLPNGYEIILILIKEGGGKTRLDKPYTPENKEAVFENLEPGAEYKLFVEGRSIDRKSEEHVRLLGYVGELMTGEYIIGDFEARESYVSALIDLERR